MERLTTIDGDLIQCQLCFEFKNEECSGEDCRYGYDTKAIKKLSEYENIGLSPKDIIHIKDITLKFVNGIVDKNIDVGKFINELPNELFVK